MLLNWPVQPHPSDIWQKVLLQELRAIDQYARHQLEETEVHYAATVVHYILQILSIESLSFHSERIVVCRETTLTHSLTMSHYLHAWDSFSPCLPPMLDTELVATEIVLFGISCVPYQVWLDELNTTFVC